MEDVLPEPYQNGAKEIRGVVTFTGGTGKYAGITGEIKFVSYQGLFRSFADNAFEAGLFNAQYMTRMARIALMPPKAMRCRPSETL